MTRPHRRRTARGYAMAFFLVLMLTLTTALLVLSLSVTEDLTSASQTYNKTQARTDAQAAADRFFAHLTGTPGYLAQALTSGTGIAAADGSQDTGQWWCWNPGASLTSATETLTPLHTQDCYRIQAKTTPQGLNGQPEVLVQITTRLDCKNDTDASCTWDAYQQRIRQNQFFDYLYYMQYTALDPSLYPPSYTVTGCGNLTLTQRATNCPTVSFRGTSAADTDTVNGPVYTDDDALSTCGAPVFNGPVYVHGPGSSGNAWQTAPNNSGNPIASCTTGAPTFNAGSYLGQPAVTLPDATSESSWFHNIAQPQWRLKSQAAPSTSASSAQRVILTATPAGVTVSGDQNGNNGTAPLNTAGNAANSAVIYVDGDVEVSGTFSGVVSIYATGDIRITGDVSYANGEGHGNTSDAVGLNAGHSVIVEQAPPSTTRTIDAILVSLTGSIYTDNWAIPQNYAAGTAPQLHLYGALASRYQGVFGGYLQSTGTLNSGYVKDFNFDDRLANGILAPPYLVQPAATAWQRLDLTEVANCQGAQTAACQQLS